MCNSKSRNRGKAIAEARDMGAAAYAQGNSVKLCPNFLGDGEMISAWFDGFQELELADFLREHRS